MRSCGCEPSGTGTPKGRVWKDLERESVDLVFLDIQMPGMNSFELLSALREQPFVILTTAFDHYALKAFEVNSIDYLVKPIEREQLARAIGKLERVRPVAKPAWQSDADLPALLKELPSSLHPQQAALEQSQPNDQGECHNDLPPEGQHQRWQVVRLGEIADEDGRGRKDGRADERDRIAACQLVFVGFWLGHALILPF